MPATAVTVAPCRNQASARGISLGMTTFFCPASNSFMNAVLIRLKKYSKPIHVIPARKWSQRSTMPQASMLDEPVMNTNTMASTIAKAKPNAMV